MNRGMVRFACQWKVSVVSLVQLAISSYLDNKKYVWAPIILHAMWIVESAYGYLKSTFANAALFKTVTRILLHTKLTTKEETKSKRTNAREKRGTVHQSIDAELNRLLHDFAYVSG